MVYGYIRVSTDRQELERQELDIRRFAADRKLGEVSIVAEKISSRKADRGIHTLAGSMKAGDVLIVSEVSRLARSMIELDGILSDLLSRKCRVYVLSPMFELDGSIQAQALKFALGLAAQIERDMVSSRTKSALAARKAQGVKLGRPEGKSKLDDMSDEIRKLRGLGLNQTAVSKLLKVNRGTLAAWLERNEK